MKIKILFLLLLSMMISSCSQTAKTPAKLKLKLSGVINLSNGVGNGGAILFGKSSTGEQFGKIVSNNEENLELSNGDWSFYAVMWDKTGTDNLVNTVYCGKGVQKLSGAAVSVAMNLSNANCTDSDFSGGTYYSEYISGAGYKTHFAKLFLEECDELGKSSSFSCMASNQGSALSYRLAFRSYEKPSATQTTFSNDVIYSSCIPVDGGWKLHTDGLRSNFPTGNTAMPFVVSVEMFLGTNDCAASAGVDTKGVYTQIFNQGLGASTAVNKAVVTTGQTCLPNVTTELQCNESFGLWTGSTCVTVPSIVSNFVPNAECVSNIVPATAASVKYIKQMVSIPQSYLCRFNDASLTGVDVFPGGDGSALRPFKICNEWQLNQIGENNSTISTSNNYKLMNDLDMNKATFGSYPKPYCAGKGDVETYFNLNPLDRMDCQGSSSGPADYTGTFNGNGKVIKNGRITTKAGETLAFVRSLSGTIKNLSFQNLEVRGANNIAGIAANMLNGSKIENIRIDKLQIEGDTYIGGIVSTSATVSMIKNVKINHGEVRGNNYLGGIVGYNLGTVNKALFRGFVVPSNTVPSSDYSGGITAYNSGTISEVASEGLLSTVAMTSGGIAGKNMGTIGNCYSTMSLIPLYSMAAMPLKAGGIVGQNYSTGTVSDCYSDSTHSYNGAGTLTYSGLVAVNDSGTLGSNSLYTNDLNSPASLLGVTYDGMRTGTVPSGVTLTTPSLWTFANGSLPRLTWEAADRECLKPENLATITIQKNTGRGLNAANPVVVCNLAQLSTISNASAGVFYKLGDDINLAKWTTASDLIPTFSGYLDGNDRGLYGLKISIADNSSSIALNNHGIIKVNNGSIKKLFLVNNQINNEDPEDTKFGILAGTNSGKISDVETYGSFVYGFFQVGGLVGVNTATGEIRGVKSNQTILLGEFEVGGIAGANQGKIIRAESNGLNIGNGTTPAYHRFGGIVGFNSNLVDQTMADAYFSFNSITTAASHEVGGLVGYNNGVISNSYTDKHMMINIWGATGVGGLVGVSDGGTAEIKNSFSLAKINFLQSEYDLTSKLDTTNDSFDDRVIGPLVGTTINNALVNNSFYLKNSLTMAPYTGGAITSCGAPVTLSGSAITATGVFQTPNMLGPMGYTYLSSTAFSPLDTFSCVVGDFVSFYKAYGNYMEYGTELSANDFSLLSTFTNAFFDIVAFDDQRVLDYHLSLMNGNGIPANAPIWQYDPQDRYPHLLQVEH